MHFGELVISLQNVQRTATRYGQRTSDFRPPPVRSRMPGGVGGAGSNPVPTRLDRLVTKDQKSALSVEYQFEQNLIRLEMKNSIPEDVGVFAQQV